MAAIEQKLTKLERDALLCALAAVEEPAWRRALVGQLEHLEVLGRSEKTTGYYVDFAVPERFRVAGISDHFNQTPPEAEATHPDGANALFFVVYVRDGLLSFMEAASTAEWPTDESVVIVRPRRGLA